MSGLQSQGCIALLTQTCHGDETCLAEQVQLDIDSATRQQKQTDRQTDRQTDNR